MFISYREILDGISNTFLLAAWSQSECVPRLPSGAFYKWIPIFTCAQIYNKHYCASWLFLEGWVDCQGLGDHKWGVVWGSGYLVC